MVILSLPGKPKLLKQNACGTNFQKNLLIHPEPGTSGSIVSDYELDDRGSIPDRGRGFFL
jgi:hypothetical protein